MRHSVFQTSVESTIAYIENQAPSTIDSISFKEELKRFSGTGHSLTDWMLDDFFRTMNPPMNRFLAGPTGELVFDRSTCPTDRIGGLLSSECVLTGLFDLGWGVAAVPPMNRWLFSVVWRSHQ
ncbi:MAG: hypothetical protein R3B96_05830 [Pirellulaceae bacterium]